MSTLRAGLRPSPRPFRRAFCRPLAAAAPILAALLLLPGASFATEIVIVNNDGAGEGFNDPTPVAPVGNNPGTTLGEQRLVVFETAAQVWETVLDSGVQVRVQSQFNPQFCDPGTGAATLGSAGTVNVFADFPNAPVAGTWFHSALADALAGVDLEPVDPDINATFNSAIDDPCLGPGTGWYYGMDQNVPDGFINLLPVVLHELAHGLGFGNFVNEQTGTLFLGMPDVYTLFTFDNTLGLHWDEMNNAQRQQSAVNTGNVVWDGPDVTGAAPDLLIGPAVVTVSAPGGIAGDYSAQAASFGPILEIPGVTASVVLAQDSVGTSTDGCESLTNGGAVAGNIALIDRGNCTFVSKVLNAQAVGAVGVIIANNVSPGLPPMGGFDPTVAIPSVGISLDDGNLFKANLPGVTAELTFDPTQLQGTDVGGRVLLNAPNPVQLGSSISHWDPLTFPNTLMEPAINDDLFDDLDLTVYQLRDSGWSAGDVFADGFEMGTTAGWSIAVP